jgi:hypothetical protein
VRVKGDIARVSETKNTNSVTHDTDDVTFLGWPRGLPLLDIKLNHSKITLHPTQLAIKSIGIVQSLANQDPDVDAIYRLTRPLPFDFSPKGLNVVVPKGTYAP